MSDFVTKKELMTIVYPYFCGNQDMVLLVGDMGFAVLDDYFNNHPNRVFNTGIAEQGTMGMAAGMSLAGLRPIVYSQIPFLTMRCFEEIKYDICEHGLNVKMIGIGADNYFHMLGKSHCMDDDDNLKILSVLKNLLVLSPTQLTLKDDVQKMFSHDGPTYIICR